MADTRNTRVAPSKETLIAGLTLVAILLHVPLKSSFHFPSRTSNLPLFLALVIGGLPLVWELLKKLWRREFGSDLLAGVSILTAIALREYLVAAIVVLMLSGGEALEAFATARASSVLDALARRMPNVAHRKESAGLVDVKLDEIRIGDELTVLPHEICPVDGAVIEGHGVMDEAYLTGEPYEVSKTPGSLVISGAINGEALLVIRAAKPRRRFALRSHHESDATDRAAAAFAPHRAAKRAWRHGRQHPRDDCGSAWLLAADLGRRRPGSDRPACRVECRARRASDRDLAGFLNGRDIRYSETVISD